MHTHDRGCLRGPVSREQSWWKSAAHPAGNRPPEDAPIRRDLVDRVRREIEAGIYDTPEKLDAALERLLRHLEEQ